MRKYGSIGTIILYTRWSDRNVLRCRGGELFLISGRYINYVYIYIGTYI